MKYLPVELTPLIKATTSLVQLWTLYLLITWGYQALHFILETLGGLFI